MTPEPMPSPSPIHSAHPESSQNTTNDADDTMIQERGSHEAAAPSASRGHHSGKLIGEASSLADSPAGSGTLSNVVSSCFDSLCQFIQYLLIFVLLKLELFLNYLVEQLQYETRDDLTEWRKQRRLGKQGDTAHLKSKGELQGKTQRQISQETSSSPLLQQQQSFCPSSALSQSSPRTHCCRFFSNSRTRSPTKRILLLRHGESLGNVHPTLFASKPDPSMPLTYTGLEQALKAGQKMNLPKTESICFYVSPYLRSWQTCERVIAGWIGLQSVEESIKGFRIEWTPEGVVWEFDPEVVYKEYGVRFRLKEDPRLRELEWSGTFQVLEEMPQQISERKKFGSFYYRFKGGENGGDAFLRVSAFLETMTRDLGKDENFVLVSHGLTLRLLLMRYYHWPVSLFHSVKNFRHCETIEMRRCEKDGRFRLAQAIRVGCGKSKFNRDNFLENVQLTSPYDVWNGDAASMNSDSNSMGGATPKHSNTGSGHSSRRGSGSSGFLASYPDEEMRRSLSMLNIPSSPAASKLSGARRSASLENLQTWEFPDAATPLTPEEEE